MLTSGKLYKSISRIDYYNNIILENGEYKHTGEPSIFYSYLDHIMFIKIDKIFYNKWNCTASGMIFLYENKLIATRPEARRQLILMEII